MCLSVHYINTIFIYVHLLMVNIWSKCLTIPKLTWFTTANQTLMSNYIPPAQPMVSFQRLKCWGIQYKQKASRHNKPVKKRECLKKSLFLVKMMKRFHLRNSSPDVLTVLVPSGFLTSLQRTILFSKRMRLLFPDSSVTKCASST